MELIKSLIALKENDRTLSEDADREQFADFSEMAIMDLESRIGAEIDDNPEIIGIRLTHDKGPYNQPIYHAAIMFDGKNDKGYRGNVYFIANDKSGHIEDFRIVDLTGAGYRKIPDSIND